MTESNIESRWQKYAIYSAVILLVFLLYTNIFARKIDLTTADLGRHIKNGEIIWSGSADDRQSLIHSNFYSYTSSEAPFVNHHWLTGLVYFGVHNLAGFVGLSYLNLILLLTTIFVLYLFSAKQWGFWPATLGVLSIAPFFVGRTEVRPEAFTYLLFVIYFCLLWSWHNQKLSSKWLWILPILQLFWVNLHIGFVFGAFVVGLFLLTHLSLFIFKKENRFKEIFWPTIGVALTTLMNPNFLTGAFYPLNVFDNYGYRVLENQSVWFLENLKLIQPYFLLWKILALVLLANLILTGLKSYRESNFWTITLLWLTFLTLSAFAIRNMALFGLLSLVVIAWSINQAKASIKTILSVVFICLSLYGFGQVTSITKNYAEAKGVGILPNSYASANFFIDNKIEGPIFNNYDIGGFLIFNLFPNEKVFVDNRPEAYKKDFFDKIYIPIQEEADEWQKAEEKYKFNAVFFSHRDNTPWGQEFLVRLINDPAWAPVFADNYAIIFLKRNSQNQPLIAKYEIPRSTFRVQSR